MSSSEVPHDYLDEFRTAVSAIHQAHADDTATAFRAVRPYFERLLHAGDEIAKRAVDTMLLRLKEDAFYQSVKWDINQVLLEVERDYALSVSILSNSPENLFNAISDSYYGILGSNSFRYTLFSHSKNSDRDVFDDSQTPSRVGEFVTSPGQVLELHSGVDIIDWEISEPVLMLRYSSKISETLQWTYSRRTLAPQFAAAAMPDSTQLMCIASFLGASRYLGSVDAMLQLAGHPHHHVRWTAIRALCALDIKSGREMAEAARSDTHPHIRKAAKQLVEKLNNI